MGVLLEPGMRPAEKRKDLLECNVAAPVAPKLSMKRLEDLPQEEVQSLPGNDDANYV